MNENISTPGQSSGVPPNESAMAGLMTKEELLARNEKILFGWMYKWVQNSANNYGRKLLGNQNDMKQIFARHKRQPGLLLASGPSVEKTLETLGGTFPGISVAVNSSLSACLKWGFKPNYVHIFDGHYLPSRLDGVPLAGLKIPLLCPNSVHPEIIEFWQKTVKGDIWAHHMWDPCNTWFTEHQWRLWSYDAIPTSGSVGPACIRLLSYLGCNPIIVAGLDLGFTDGLYRVPQYYCEKGKWKARKFDDLEAINRQPLIYEAGCQSWKTTGILYKVATIAISKMMKEEGLVFVRMYNINNKPGLYQTLPTRCLDTSGTDVLNATEGGIWEDEIPRVDMSKFMKGAREWRTETPDSSVA